MNFIYSNLMHVAFDDKTLNEFDCIHVAIKKISFMSFCNKHEKKININYQNLKD